VTTIVEMPFDSTGAINTVERFERKRELVVDEARVDVAMLATLAPGGGWREAEKLAAAGAAGFKVSLFDTDPNRFPRVDDAELLDVMAAVGATGLPLCVHAENNEIVKALIAHEKAEHPRDPRAHLRSRPPVSETLGVLTALEIAANRGTKLHLCHLSLSRSIDLVRWYAEQQVDVSLETCPHYLTFGEQDMDIQRGHLKINPPLRSAEDRAGLWDHLDAGNVKIIASDHAPWPRAEKEFDEIFANHSGAPGVETMVPATLTGALRRGMATFDLAVDALTINPAKRFGLDDRKGRIAVGYDADLTAFDPSREWTVDSRSLHSNADWSPYHERTMSGRITLTVSRGRIVWDGTNVAERSAGGEILRPTA
jgi:allantoinase